MLERTIENKCTQYAKAKGWLSFKFVSPNNKGVPDRLYIKAGVVVFVEFKAPGKTPTKLQVHIIDKLIAHGAIVHVCDSIEQFKGIIDAYC